MNDNIVISRCVALLVLIPFVIFLQFSPKIKNIFLKYGFSEVDLIKGLCYKFVMLSVVLFYIASDCFHGGVSSIVIHSIGFAIAVFALILLIDVYKAYKNFNEIKFCMLLCMAGGVFNLIGLLGVIR